MYKIHVRSSLKMTLQQYIMANGVSMQTAILLSPFYYTFLNRRGTGKDSKGIFCDVRSHLPTFAFLKMSLLSAQWIKALLPVITIRYHNFILFFMYQFCQLLVIIIFGRAAKFCCLSYYIWHTSCFLSSKPNELKWHFHLCTFGTCIPNIFTDLNFNYNTAKAKHTKSHLCQQELIIQFIDCYWNEWLHLCW